MGNLPTQNPPGPPKGAEEGWVGYEMEAEVKGKLKIPIPRWM